MNTNQTSHGPAAIRRRLGAVQTRIKQIEQRLETAKSALDSEVANSQPKFEDAAEQEIRRTNGHLD